MISIERYCPGNKEDWNNFNATAKNGLFLFDRNYMEYHESRFSDHSLLVYKGDHLIATFPANFVNDALVSHAGLTFGGLITGMEINSRDVVAVFSDLMDYWRENKIKSVRYKAIPFIYHTIPAEEDRYAIFIHGGHLIQRDLSSSINLGQPLRISAPRLRKIRQAERRGLRICEDENYSGFWEILENNLQKRYNKCPVHTLDEIILLKKRFPENIRLFSCYEENRLVSGVVVYESRNVAHIQYNASSERGRELSALDLIILRLIAGVFTHKNYFDFGISTELGGSYLNKDLAFFKESFGASTIVHDTYELIV
jgi:hypothetical protein